MQRFEINLLVDELHELILSFLPIHEVYFNISKVSKQFRYTCNELLLFHEYNKVRIEQFNQSPIKSNKFTSSERLKFVKFSIRNLIYEYSTFIVKNFHGCFNERIRTKVQKPSFEFLHKAEIDFIELSSIFNNFQDIPNHDDNKPIEEEQTITEEEFQISNTNSNEISDEKVKTSKIDVQKGRAWLTGDYELRKQFFHCVFNAKSEKYHRGPPIGVVSMFSILNFKIAMETTFSPQSNFWKRNNSNKPAFFIFLENPYSNTLKDLEHVEKYIKENSKLCELILVTTMKDLESNESRIVSQEEASWHVYQNYNGALHKSIRNTTVSELEDLLIISLYCSVLKCLLANHQFDQARPLYRSTLEKI